MNKKENDQLKKIDQLDKQLDNTINKIGVTKVEPIKISKKKLVLFMLIPFSIACVLSAITSFLVIDPFHWYTKTRLTLEQKQEKTIKQIKQKFADLSLATVFDSSNTIADLLWEMKHSSSINDIIQSPNEIIAITSKKDNESKLSSIGEEVNIKILVRTGSLEKEINIALTIIVDNQTVKQVNGLVKYPQFLDSITSKIAADGVKRVSNLVDVIKTIINEDKMYKAVFKDINFDIINDKDDDEIIASGSKTLNINFNFTESNKLINSSVKLNVNLQGKSRKEINQDLANRILYLSILSFGSNNFTFYAQNTFANASTYRNLIDELISSASENHFYLVENGFKSFDNSNSGISVNFKIDGKTDAQLDENITNTSNHNWYINVELKLQFFVGNNQDKCIVNKLFSFSINVIKEDYPQKDLVLALNKLRKVVLSNLLNYEVKIRLDGISTFKDLKAELKIEVDRILKLEPTTNNISYRINNYHSSQSNENMIISKDDLFNGIYYLSIYFAVSRDKIEGNIPPDSIFVVPILVKKIELF